MSNQLPDVFPVDAPVVNGILRVDVPNEPVETFATEASEPTKLDYEAAKETLEKAQDNIIKEFRCNPLMQPRIEQAIRDSVAGAPEGLPVSLPFSNIENIPVVTDHRTPFLVIECVFASGRVERLRIRENPMVKTGPNRKQRRTASAKARRSK